MSEFLVTKCAPIAKLPTRATSGSVGYDLYAFNEQITIPSGDRKLIRTGIKIKIPDGHYGRIAPRSGLAYRNGIDVLAGVIDRDYEGELKVILYNTSREDFTVYYGDRIAQLILERCSTPPIVEISLTEYSEHFRNDNDESNVIRGEGGFGSTN
jgi:dUTP pyrophosphatase